MNLHFLYDSAGTRPEIYTEPMPTKQLQYLYISSITPAMAGNYTCVATYTNVPLSTSVILDTFSKYTLIFVYLE